MADLQDFLNNPPKFMRNNHVRYCGVYPQQAGVSHAFVLLRVAGAARRKRLFLGMDTGKTDAGVFEIRVATGGNISPGAVNLGTFNAIWSGYQARAAVRCDLTPQGDGIMLTPELTGCTVVCAPQPSGDAAFSHYNLRDPNDDSRTMDAAGVLAYASADYQGSDYGVLPKEAYYAKAPGAGSRPRATVIGWRSGGQWTFWTQYVEEKGGVFQIRDVQQLCPGTRFG